MRNYLNHVMFSIDLGKERDLQRLIERFLIQFYNNINLMLYIVGMNHNSDLEEVVFRISVLFLKLNGKSSKTATGHL